MLTGERNVRRGRGLDRQKRERRTDCTGHKDKLGQDRREYRTNMRKQVARKERRNRYNHTVGMQQKIQWGHSQEQSVAEISNHNEERGNDQKEERTIVRIED